MAQIVASINPIISTRIHIVKNLQFVVLPPQESMDNGPSLFNYGLDDLYNDLIDDFDPYLEYGEGYQNRMAFKNNFYR